MVQPLQNSELSPERLRAKERRLRVFDMRLLGATLRQIGDKLGVSHETVRTDLRKALDELTELEREKADNLRTLDLARIDTAIRALAPKVMEGDLQTVDRWLKLLERRSKLLGLDAPQQLEVASNDLAGKTDEELEAIIAAGEESPVVEDCGDDPGADDDSNN